MIEEMEIRSFWLPNGSFASMRPRSLDRGNNSVDGDGLRATHASMRPRSLDRGNKAEFDSVSKEHMLQ